MAKDRSRMIYCIKNYDATKPISFVAFVILYFTKEKEYMCRRKEYKCYKGETVGECCNNRVEEAVKHRTYVILMIIAVALLIFALTVKTGSNKVFVEQVSFASTITSIILSVIAIWMSITGERNTNEIKNKVSEAACSLTMTTTTSKEVSEKLQTMLDEQNNKYNTLIEKLEKSIEASEGINSKISDVQKSFEKFSGSETKNASDINPCEIMENLLESLTDNKMKLKLFEVVDYVMANRPIRVSKVLDYLIECGNNEVDSSYVLGMTYVLCKNGLLEPTKEYGELKKKYIDSIDK